MLRPTILLLLLAGCGDGAGEAVNDGANRAEPVTTPMVTANATRDAEDVLGAVPGECGSTRVEAFLGRPFEEDMEEALWAQSGASAVRVHRWSAEGPVDESSDARRLNVMLSPSGRVVLLDCG